MNHPRRLFIIFRPACAAHYCYGMINMATNALQGDDLGLFATCFDVAHGPRQRRYRHADRALPIPVALQTALDIGQQQVPRLLGLACGVTRFAGGISGQLPLDFVGLMREACLGEVVVPQADRRHLKSLMQFRAVAYRRRRGN